jgi:hypothetical protein
MMHDFALSAEHIVFMDLPVRFRLDVARNSPRDLPFRWSDDYGARLGVLRRDDPYGPIRWFDIHPCYVFHVLNAFDKATDDGKLIVLEAARYPELWRAPGFDAVMWSWTINLTRGTVTEQQIDERPIEFPRIDDRRAGMPARSGVTVGSGRLVRYDLERGTAEEHYVSDAQKYFVLKLRKGLIEDGLFAHTRNPNYLGEILIYGGFVLASWHWQALLVLAGWFAYFVRNMRRKDRAMSRHPEFAAYAKRTGMLIPVMHGKMLDPSSEGARGIEDLRTDRNGVSHRL